MKKFKKVLCLALVCALLAGVLPASALAVEAHVSIASLEYKKDSNGNVTITDCPTGARGTLDIPATLDGGTVVAIGEKAFYYCDQITQVSIPSTVTKIGSEAFYACSALTGVVIPDSVTEIGSGAFHYAGIQNAVVGSGIKKLPTTCFGTCKNLTEVSLPYGLEEIGISAFEYCYALTSIVLPATLKTIESSAFTQSGIVSIVLPAGVEKVGGYAFMDCKSLQSVTFNNGLKTIGGSSFTRTALESVVIPDSVTYVGQYAFASISTLRSATVGGGVEDLSRSCLRWNENLETLIVRDGVKSITDDALQECTSLKTLYLPGSLLEVEQYSFRYVDGIEDIYYGGTSYGWGGVAIGKDNGNLLGEDVEMHYIPFTDTNAGDYYYDPMVWAIDEGITNGTTLTTFSPASTCTQGQILTFLYRAADEPAVSGGSPYTNSIIAPDKYYYNPLLWAYQQGVISDKNLDPDAPCTRADVVSYLWRLAGKPSGGSASFTDVPASADYAKAVAWAVKEGITTGTSATEFSPAATCTRAQIVTFLYRDAH